MRWEPDVAVFIGVMIGLAFVLMVLKIIGVL